MAQRLCSPKTSVFRHYSGQLPAMQEITKQLGGVEQFTGGGGSPLVKWPQS